MIKLAKYFVTGLIAAVVDFSIFLALMKYAAWPWYLAGTVSFLVATLVNYVISVKLVFTSGVRFGKHHEVALTFLVSLIGLGINQLVMYVLIGQGVAILLAKVAATGVVFMWNYMARHRFVFRAAPR